MAGVKYWDGINNRTIPNGSEGQQLTMTSGVPTWGAAGGSVALDDLTDVVITAAAQGELLAHNGTNWVDFAVGTTGLPLITKGAAANPIWEKLAVANLQHASESQGDILIRDGTGWTRLGAGASGLFLKTQGAGANSVWAAASGGLDVYTYANLPAYDASRYLAYDTDTFTLWVWIYGANGFWFPAVPGPGLDVFIYHGNEAGSGAVANAGSEKWYYYKSVSGTWRTSPRLSRPTMEMQIPAASATWTSFLFAGIDAVGNYPMRTWNLTQDYGMVAIVSQTLVQGGAQVGFLTFSDLTGTFVNPNVRFQFNVGADTNWYILCRNAAGAGNPIDTGVAVSTIAFQELAIKGKAATNIKYYINGALNQTVTTNLADAVQSAGVYHYAFSGNSAKSFHFNYIIFWQKSV